MYISDSTYELLNEFIRKCFQTNSYCDNLTYNMSSLNMINAEPVFHEKFAHMFPAFADIISGVMTQLGRRPVRQSLNSDIEEYDNFKSIFEDLKKYIDQYRNDIIGVIESADLNGDIEVKITMEKFLSDFMKYLHQVNVWYKKSKEYDSIEDFDQDFHSFTFI